MVESRGSRVPFRCGVWRSLAVFCDCFVSLVADDEDAGSGFDDVVGDGVELVDLEDPVDLGEEPFEQAEVASGDAFDGGDCLGVGEVVRVESSAEALPVAVEDEEELLAAQCAVLVREAEAAVELWVVAEAFVDAGHADEDHREVGTVVLVPEQLEGGGREPFGFVDDQQLDEPSHVVLLLRGRFWAE